MGYNPTYATADVAPERRDELLGRDMQLMASVGVNMVLGWEPGVFDERLLAPATATSRRSSCGGSATRSRSR
jgi:hypothetical protein